MTRLLTLRCLLVALAILSYVSHGVIAADSPRIAIGISYADATKQLAAASVAEASPLQIEPRDPDTVLEFFTLDRDAVLVIGRSAAAKNVKTLSVYYIPDNRTSRGQAVSVAARSIEFRSDKSYIVHFEAPAKESKIK